MKMMKEEESQKKRKGRKSRPFIGFGGVQRHQTGRMIWE
jgi:hypothetical protein